MGERYPVGYAGWRVSHRQAPGRASRRALLIGLDTAAHVTQDRSLATVQGSVIPGLRWEWGG